jgi:hypothetical protein
MALFLCPMPRSASNDSSLLFVATHMCFFLSMFLCECRAQVFAYSGVSMNDSPQLSSSMNHSATPQDTPMRIYSTDLCQLLEVSRNRVEGSTDVLERDVLRCIRMNCSLNLINHLKQRYHCSLVQPVPAFPTMEHSSLM